MKNFSRLAQFSKFLNKLPLPVAKPQTRFGQLRNISTSLKNAGDEALWKTNHKIEAIVHLNKKGKASKLKLGTAKGVNPVYTRYPKTEIYTVHNHPQNTSLSPKDISNIKNPRQQVIAVDEYGSRYRAYPKNPEAANMTKWILDKHKDLDNLNFRFLENQGIKNSEARSLVASHARNRALKRANLIHYSAQIRNPIYTPEMKQKVRELEEELYRKYSKTIQDYQKYKDLASLDF